jgi:hypothetical protein
MDYGTEGFYTRLNSGAIHRVNRANMFSELMITPFGGDMVSVRIIPEPATLALLALGGAVVIRRRRA